MAIEKININSPVYLKIENSAGLTSCNLTLAIYSGAFQTSPSTTYSDYTTYSDGEADDKTVHPERIITGLTPGQSYTYDLFARTSSSTVYLEWGGDECAPLAYVLTLP